MLLMCRKLSLCVSVCVYEPVRLFLYLNFIWAEHFTIYDQIEATLFLTHCEQTDLFVFSAYTIDVPKLCVKFFILNSSTQSKK